ARLPGATARRTGRSGRCPASMPAPSRRLYAVQPVPRARAPCRGTVLPPPTASSEAPPSSARGLGSSILQPPHELDPRPHIVHRRHLHVHQAMSQPDGADHVLREIARHAGRLLGPGNPQHAGGSERARQRGELPLEFPLLRREQLDEIERAPGIGLPNHVPRQLPERSLIAPGRIEDRDRGSWLDPELVDEPSRRVTRHTLPPSPALYAPFHRPL